MQEGKYISLLETTQNTRDLGGYRTKNGAVTKEGIIFRSDAQNYPNERDYAFLQNKGITTIIDMRGEAEVERRPSGFAGKEGFDYFNYPIVEGSSVPESREAVPTSYMIIAQAKSMPNIFRRIANAKSGVMYNCSAGKDRTGVVTAILLMHAGAGDADIIENYVLTKEYAKERLELVHKNFPEIDMSIVTPCEMFMEEFLRMFREKFGDTNTYFTYLGLDQMEIQKLREKL